jgi:hypothetical protein
VYDLGPVAIADLPAGDVPAPSWLSARDAEVWTALARVRTAPRGTRTELYAIEEDELRARALDDDQCWRLGSAPAVLDHTYIVRSILPGEHDVFAAFTPIAEDAHGQWIAWRILRSWPAKLDSRARPR